MFKLKESKRREGITSYWPDGSWFVYIYIFIFGVSVAESVPAGLSGSSAAAEKGLRSHCEAPQKCVFVCMCPSSWPYCRLSAGSRRKPSRAERVRLNRIVTRLLIGVRGAPVYMCNKSTIWGLCSSLPVRSLSRSTSPPVGVMITRCQSLISGLGLVLF